MICHHTVEIFSQTQLEPKIQTYHHLSRGFQYLLIPTLRFDYLLTPTSRFSAFLDLVRINLLLKYTPQKNPLLLLYSLLGDCQIKPIYFCILFLIVGHNRNVLLLLLYNYLRSGLVRSYLYIYLNIF